VYFILFDKRDLTFEQAIEIYLSHIKHDKENSKLLKKYAKTFIKSVLHKYITGQLVEEKHRPAS